MWGNPVAEMMYEGLRYLPASGSPTGAFALSIRTAGEERGSRAAACRSPPGIIPTATARAAPSRSKRSSATSTRRTTPTSCRARLSAAGFGGDLAGLDVANLGQTDLGQRVGRGRQRFSSASPAQSSATARRRRRMSRSSATSAASRPRSRPSRAATTRRASPIRRTTETDPEFGRDRRAESSTRLPWRSPRRCRGSTSRSTGRTSHSFRSPRSVGGLGHQRRPGPASNRRTRSSTSTSIRSTPTTGKFRVNFEDVEQGADHDMDAIVMLQYTVSGSTVSVTVDSDYAAGGIMHHMGYIMSGIDPPTAPTS